MKQSPLKYLFIAAISLTAINIHVLATDNPWDYASDYLTRDYLNYSTVSAHVTDMFHYGEFQTSLFTGRLQVSVPIYTVNDPDFKTNIALHYNAEGFKPRKHSGYVGYNWFLEAGGCITREVNGRPDEIIGYSDHYKNNYFGPQDYPKVEGMYHYIFQHPEAANIDVNDIFSLPLSPISDACVYFDAPWHNVGDSCEYEVDYMPDIFHFDFLGHKGSFMINNAGKIQIISGDFVDVDLSGILANWEPTSPLTLFDSVYPMYPEEKSTITIQTTDGYTYVFGGDYSKLEYTVNVHNKGEFLPPLNVYDRMLLNPPVVSTWHLAEIIAPNKRTVTYHYKPSKKSEIYDLFHEMLDSAQCALWRSVPGIYDPLWEFNEYVNRFYAFNRASDGFYRYMWNRLHVYDHLNAFIDENSLYNYYYALDFALLANTPEGTAYYLRSATKTCILDSILISGEQPLKIIFDNSQESTAMYDTQTYGINSKRNYQLDSIRILSSDNTIKTANLSYEYQGSYNVKWRFLNRIHISGIGTYQMTYNNGPYPNLSNPTPDYVVGTGESNETDDYGYYVGRDTIALLQKLTYPTGGYQTYSYQKYSFNKTRKYSIDEECVVDMHDSVHYTKYKRGVRIRKVNTYDRTNHLVESKSYTYSDGVFYDNLYVYGLADDMYPGKGWPIRFRANYGLSAHIGYGKVTEEVTNTQGVKYKTIYRFDMGENSYTSLNDNDMLGSYPYGSPRFGALTGTMSYGSKLRKWGKLTSVETYDSNNILQRSTHYEYNDISHVICDTIVTYFHDCLTEMSKRLYVYPDVMTQQVTYDYSQGDSLSISKYFTYDRKLRLKKEMVRDSHNTQHFTRYSYPDDIPGAATFGSFPSPLFLMIHSCRIGDPVETISGYISNGTEYVTSGTIDIYTNKTYPVNNNLNTRTCLYQTLSLALSEPIARANYQPMNMSNGQVSYDSHYKLDCEYDFDIMYRPLSIKPFGQWATTYTWNGIYPASKTVGNQTWTYTHIPHVGVSSITDPRGITTYYSYDQYGRLIEEYQLFNSKKQIRNAYHYHIKTE